MFVIVAVGKVKQEHLDRYLEEIRLDAIGSVNDEPGCLRFDVVQDRDDPTRICLYEIYTDEAAFGEHVKAPHFVRYAEATKDLWDQPLNVVFGTSFTLTEDNRRAR